MRARATETFNTYYEGVPMTVEAGDILEGPIAEFLHQGGSAVEPISDPGDSDSKGSGPAPAGFDVSGTVPDILAAVGDDPGKAAAAYEAEQQQPKPRATLLSKLDEIAGSGD